jgi:NAD(P) transhydrogenase subunit beta
VSESHIETIRNLAYLLASVLFIFGLKGLTHPRTAVRGMQLGALGMFVAVLATVMAGGIVSWWWVLSGLLIGSVIGIFTAIWIPMTDIPQMVALFNGFGGAASFLVAGSELVVKVNTGTAGVEADVASAASVGGELLLPSLVAIAASGMIGSLTLFGSLIAAGKLHEISFSWGGKKVWMSNPLLLPGRHAITAVCFGACLVVCALIVMNPTTSLWYWVLIVLAAAFGILITIPIGGADMPVVIALLNSYSGLAACATGFVIDNTVLIIAGALVGASGLILTNIMCKAMNRSLANVMFAALGEGGGEGGPSADDVYEGKVKSTSAEEVAMLFDGAQRVVIVPGYGMAVSQAQHAVRDLANLLESRGTDVEFAIHPVAGRMPGHMNVLLAEADIPYDKLKEMDDINPTLETVDVALVIGANDVVNPVARTDPSSPIAGMPIIDVDKCRTVVVIKRSLSPGFAGIPNPLFAGDNTLMLFNDGKKAFLDLMTAVKEG